MEEIINRVAGSSLVSLDMDEYMDISDRVSFDLKQGLFQGMILKEKEFRTFIKDYDWNQFQGKNVAVYCSVDTIVPTWAYMLVATRLQPVANVIAFGKEEELEKAIIDRAIEKILKKELQDAKVVIKGCGDIKNRDYAYFQLTNKLTPVVSSIMYGEPCSTVPVFKRKNQ